jgi:hypothetical protein
VHTHLDGVVDSVLDDGRELLLDDKLELAEEKVKELHRVLIVLHHFAPEHVVLVAARAHTHART